MTKKTTTAAATSRAYRASRAQLQVGTNTIRVPSAGEVVEATTPITDPDEPTSTYNVCIAELLCDARIGTVFEEGNPDEDCEYDLGEWEAPAWAVHLGRALLSWPRPARRLALLARFKADPELRNAALAAWRFGGRPALVAMTRRIKSSP